MKVRLFTLLSLIVVMALLLALVPGGARSSGDADAAPPAATTADAEDMALMGHLDDSPAQAMRSANGDWHTETVDSEGGHVGPSGLALDRAGNPHIVNGNGRYAFWDDDTGAWQIESPSGVCYGSLVLDEPGNSHISYGWEDNWDYDLRYAHRDAETGTWWVETVDSIGNVGPYSDVALGPTGNPHISYFDWSNSDLKYAHWNDDISAWQIEVVDSAGVVGMWTSLTVDTSGNPHIAYYDQTNGDPKYAYWNGSTWQIERVTDEGWVLSISLALDGAGNPHISYIEVSDDELKYAYRNAGTGAWHVETVGFANDMGTTSLALDEAGNPHISYMLMGVEYTYWDAGASTWQSETVDIDGGISALALDSFGNPHIAYTDGDGLKHAWKEVDNIVIEARADIGMPYSAYRGCPSPYTGCGGPYHGFYFGVCTDLAMDAYNAGVLFNLQDALYQDHLAHPGRYRYGSARYPEGMRRYFHYNQQWLPHSQAYQPGDIAFFDWNTDGLCDHVGVISQVDGDGRPLRIVHAPGVCEVSPSGQAFEQDWNSHYDQHIQGHGRLGETGSLSAPADETLQLLRITIDSPSVALRLHDANGKSTSDTYDENLVASGVEASIPYIPGGWYADLGTERVITVTWPLSNTSQYFVELTGEAAITYHLHIETLQGASVTDSEVFTQTIAAGETHGSAITLSAPGGTIEFSATSPTPAPLPGIPESLELAGLVGTSAQGTFTITETGGQQALHNVALSATNLMDSLGGMMLGSLLSIDPTDFTVSAGGSQQVNAQVSLSDATPGVYRGALVLRSDNGGTQMVPLILDVQFHQVYLPTIFKSY